MSIPSKFSPDEIGVMNDELLTYLMDRLRDRTITDKQEALLEKMLGRITKTLEFQEEPQLETNTELIKNLPFPEAPEL